MGKEKYRQEIEQIFKKSPVVSYDSIERIVKSKKNVKQYTKRLVNYLLSKNRISRLAKGYYTSRSEVSLCVFAFQPGYLGLQDALSFYNLWEQETIPIIVTSRKIRQGIRNVLGQNVLVRRIKKEYLFGIEYYQEGEVAIPYSDIEKTFIDMVYFNENLNEGTLGEFRKIIDRKKLNVYLKKYPSRFKRRVLSYLEL